MPISVSPFGSDTLVRLSQSLHKPKLVFVTAVADRSSAVSAEQPLNTLDPVVCRLEGKATVESDVQSRNASLPINVRPLQPERSAEVTAVRRKALLPISVRLDGKLMLVSAVDIPNAIGLNAVIGIVD